VIRAALCRRARSLALGAWINKLRLAAGEIERRRSERTDTVMVVTFQRHSAAVLTFARCGAVFACLLAGGAGCVQNESGEWEPIAAVSKDEGPVSSNIIKVSKYFSSEPWLSFSSDGSGRVEGVKFSVYLEGAEKPSGVFGTGNLIVTMYVIHRDRAGNESVSKEHEWEFTSAEAYPFRAKKRTLMGWGYGMRLQWPSELKLAGKQVAFVVKYAQENGRIISSTRQILRVPKHGGPDLPLT
jgi:hypothetical protein